MARNVKLCTPAALLAAKKSIGWQRRDGSEIIGNDKMSTKILHVAICDGDKHLYDQPLRCEAGGGVFLPVDAAGRIGLQKQWRPQTLDQAAWKAEYPNVDVTKLGRDSWEAPRGFGHVTETGAEAAVREAQEETQSAVVSFASLGETCDNTTFSPHMTSMQIGLIDPSKKPVGDKKDPNEKLSNVEFFTLKEIKQMRAEGKIYDAYTLSAIGAYFIDAYGN